jgi:hypothetical protein
MIRAYLTAVSISSVFVSQQPSTPPASCQLAGAIARLQQLPEASGIAASRRVPGRFWTHKDSGQPFVFALDARGAVVGQIPVPGAKVDDWEAVAVGPCPAGSCVYVGDIGDNEARRRQITVYRFAEPGNQLEAPASSEVFHATYPDGAQDAEALLIAPDGRLFVVTKGTNAPVALYAFPPELRAGATVRLERIRQPRDREKVDKRERITDGAVSPDGRWVVLRTTGSVAFYRAADLLSGNWREASRVDLGALGEPQGEGISFGTGNELFLVGEGGGNGQPGTFARLVFASSGDL